MQNTGKLALLVFLCVSFSFAQSLDANTAIISCEDASGRVLKMQADPMSNRAYLYYLKDPKDPDAAITESLPSQEDFAATEIDVKNRYENGMNFITMVVLSIKADGPGWGFQAVIPFDGNVSIQTMQSFFAKFPAGSDDQSVEFVTFAEGECTLLL